MDFLKNIDFGELLGKAKDLIGKVDWGDILNKLKPIFNKILDFLKRTPSILVALVVLLTLLFDPPAQSTGSCSLVSEKIYALTDAVYLGNGMANDGEFFYTSGSISGVMYTSLAKYDITTGKQVKSKNLALDFKKILKGYNYVGGISYYNGSIYAAMVSTGKKSAPCIAEFDADSLNFVTSYDLPDVWFPNGLAWVAVNPENGRLYTADSGEINSIHEFKVDSTMAHVREIDLDEPLSNIRGGEVYKGKLYLSRNNPGTKMKSVLKMDTYNGSYEEYFLRDAGKNVLAGDLTIYAAEDGSLFHFADYNRLVSVYIRNYIVL